MTNANTSGGGDPNANTSTRGVTNANASDGGDPNTNTSTRGATNANASDGGDPNAKTSTRGATNANASGGGAANASTGEDPNANASSEGCGMAGVGAGANTVGSGGGTTATSKPSLPSPDYMLTPPLPPFVAHRIKGSLIYVSCNLIYMSHQIFRWVKPPWMPQVMKYNILLSFLYIFSVISCPTTPMVQDQGGRP